MPPIALAPADRRAADEFIEVWSTRELPDGRLLVVDVRERRVVVVDWNTGRVVQVGRDGEGPGEYRAPRDLVALGGDTTVLTDGQSRRWIVLAGSSATQTLDANGPLPRLSALLYGGSAEGSVVTLVGRVVAGAPFERGRNRIFPEFAETTLVIRARLGRDRVDTLARLGGGYAGPSRDIVRRVGGNTITYVMNSAYVAFDQPRQMRDGWLAVAYQRPYRVDWRSPQGQWLRGRPLPEVRVRLTDQEKRAVIAHKWKGFIGQMWEPGDYPHWPEFVPPFERHALLETPDGDLAIRRTPSVTAPGTDYDIVDRRGQLLARLSLSPAERVVGFGARSVYVVTRDADDVERLARHPWRSPVPR